MKESFAEILNGYFRRLLPILTTFVLVLIAFVPTHVPLSHFLRPDFGLICLYFWALYRTDLFGIVSVIAIGLVVDSLSGAPFGMNIMVFVFAYILTLCYNNYVNAKSFMLSWIGFSFVSFLAYVLKWALFSVYYKTFLSFGHIFVTYIVTVLIYPLIASLNVYIQNSFLGGEEVIDEQR